jgi:hypothetical protein
MAVMCNNDWRAVQFLQFVRAKHMRARACWAVAAGMERSLADDGAVLAY